MSRPKTRKGGRTIAVPRIRLERGDGRIPEMFSVIGLLTEFTARERPRIPVVDPDDPAAPPLMLPPPLRRGCIVTFGVRWNSPADAARVQADARAKKARNYRIAMPAPGIRYAFAATVVEVTRGRGQGSCRLRLRGDPVAIMET